LFSGEVFHYGFNLAQDTSFVKHYLFDIFLGMLDCEFVYENL